MFRIISICVLLCGAVFLVSACGGSSADRPATGNVAVVFTDGPIEKYDRMLVTMTGMTLIGAGGQVALYDGEPVTFDLLDMSEWGDLAFNTKVVAGTYNKIRLYISKIELIDTDPPGSSQTITNLAAAGKIDLNPRGSFEVSPDWTTVIKLDIDAERSFQVVQTGNGKLKFRPVVFVDVFQGDIFLPERLVRVFGTVEAGSIEGADTGSDGSDDSFRICDLEFLSQVSGAVVGDPSACVRVYADANPSLFDDTGAEVSFATLTEGSLVTTVGFLTETDDAGAVLGLDSVVVTVGDRRPDDVNGWGTLQGVVASDPASSATCAAPDSCFDFLPDGVAPSVVARMQPGTRVFRADGVELTQADVGTNDAGSLESLQVSGEEYVALVVLDNDPASGIASGTLDSVDEVGTYDRLVVIADAGGMVNVCADSDTNIVQLLVDDDSVTIFDLLDPKVLEPGILVEAFGDPAVAPAGCDVIADMIILEPAPATP